jgi:hypothetical protein
VPIIQPQKINISESDLSDITAPRRTRSQTKTTTSENTTPSKVTTPKRIKSPLKTTTSNKKQSYNVPIIRPQKINRSDRTTTISEKTIPSKVTTPKKIKSPLKTTTPSLEREQTKFIPISEYETPYSVPEVGWQIVQHLDIDKLIDMYTYGDEIYRRMLDNAYILRELDNKYGVSKSQNFAEFIAKVSRVYPTKECFLFNTVQDCFNLALKYGNLEIAKEAVERGVTKNSAFDHFLDEMEIAALSNNNELIKWLYNLAIKKFGKSSEKTSQLIAHIIYGGSETGNLDILEWAVTRLNKKGWRYIIANYELIDTMIELSASNNKPNVIYWIVEKLIPEYLSGYFKGLDQHNYEMIISSGIDGKNSDLVNYGLTNIKKILSKFKIIKLLFKAVIIGNVLIVNLIYNYIITKYSDIQIPLDSLLEYSVLSGDLDIINFVYNLAVDHAVEIDWKILTKMLLYAQYKGYKNVIEWIQEIAYEHRIALTLTDKKIEDLKQIFDSVIKTFAGDGYIQPNKHAVVYFHNKALDLGISTNKSEKVLKFISKLTNNNEDLEDESESY